MSTTTTFIPEFRVEDLTREIKRLNKRAAKLGVEEIKFSLTGKTEVREFSVTTQTRFDGEHGEKTEVIKVIAVEATITGQSPVLANWEFAASIDMIEEGKNVLRVIPSFDKGIPLRFRSATSECDHCKQNRKRNNTFVLHNTVTDEFTQIGRQCLRDFLGHEDIHAVTDAASFMSEFRRIVDECGDFSGDSERRAKPVYSVERILEIAIALIEKNGFVSRKSASESERTSTASSVLDVLAKSSRLEWLAASEKAEVEALLTPTAQQSAFAVEALDWAVEQGANNPSQYIANLAIICSCEFIKSESLGILCSLPAAFLKARGELAKKAAKVNEYVGEIGEKREFAVTLIASRQFDTQFGTSTLLIFEDEAGRSLKWFASSSPFCDDDIAKSFKIKGTIKDHSEYNSTKQTVLLRVKVL